MRENFGVLKSAPVMKELLCTNIFSSCLEISRNIRKTWSLMRHSSVNTRMIAWTKTNPPTLTSTPTVDYSDHS